jgi:hypothetical protein
VKLSVDLVAEVGEHVEVVAAAVLAVARRVFAPPVTASVLPSS